MGLAFLLAFLTLPCLTAPSPAALRDETVDRRALLHDPNGPDQVVWSSAENPRLRFLTLRLRVRADDVRLAGVRLYLVNAQNQEGFRDHELEPCAAADSFEYRAVTVPFEDDPLAPPTRTHWRGYRFWCDDDGRIVWYGADTTATGEEKVRRFTSLFRRGAELNGVTPGLSDRTLIIPGWVQDAVALHTWLPAEALNSDSLLAARLDGLRRQLRGVDSTGVNTLVVGALPDASFPLDRCWPPEPSGDAVADSIRAAPTPFGRLAALCESAHRRRMKIMLQLTVPPGDEAVLDSTLSLVRHGIGCGVDGFYLVPGRPPEADAWQVLYETAKALLPECYLVVRPGGGDSAAPESWLTGDRVDAVHDAWLSRTLSGFLAHDAALTAEAFDRALGARRLRAPAPLLRTTWLSADAGESEAGFDRLRALLQLTLQGVPQLGEDRSAPAGQVLAPTGIGRALAGLLPLRRAHPALRRGSFTPMHAAGGQYAFLRRSSEEILLVAVNRDDTPATFRIALPKGVGFVSTKDVVDLLTGDRYPVRGGEILFKDFKGGAGVVIQLR